MAKKEVDKILIENFAKEYYTSGNATESYKKIFDCKNWKYQTIKSKASTLLKNEYFLETIERLRGQTEKESIADSMELQKTLTEIIRDQRQEECIVTEGTGKGYTQSRLMNKKVQPKDILKAIELLAKLNGYNAEKDGVNAPITINLNRNYD